MARDNSSSQLDDESHQMKRQFINVHFDDEPENLLISDWRNKEWKHKCATLAEKDCVNTAAWRINSQEKLLTEIDIDLDGVLMMILDMCNIYTNYMNQANYVDKQCKKI